MAASNDTLSPLTVACAASDPATLPDASESSAAWAASALAADITPASRISVSSIFGTPVRARFNRS